MDKALELLVGQIPVAVLFFLALRWLLNRQDKIDKLREESREKEMKFQEAEAEKQRKWNEEQENKRNEFQKKLNDSTMEFIGCLQKDQKESVSLLNKSIELVAGKTDLVLERLSQHHNFAEKSINEIDKWRNGIQVNKKE